MKRQSTLRLILIWTLLLSLGACSSIDEGDLLGMRSLERLTVDGEAINLEPIMHQSTIRFRSFTGELKGTGGCNDFRGTFTYADGSMAFGEVFWDAAFCLELPVRNEVDGALQRLLIGDISVSGDKERYVLSGNGVQAMYILLED